MSSLLEHEYRLCVYYVNFRLCYSEGIEGETLNWTAPAMSIVLRPSTAFSLNLQSAKATADRKSASKPIGFEGDLRGQSSDLPERLHSQEVDLASSQGDCLMAGNESEEALTALMSRKTAISLFEGKALGLDKAILHSVDCCCKLTLGTSRQCGCREVQHFLKNLQACFILALPEAGDTAVQCRWFLAHCSCSASYSSAGDGD